MLTTSTTVPSSTPIVGTERIALGGSVAITDSVLGQLQARRVAGADRYATAAAIARDAFTSAQTVYLVTALNFPDALAGAPTAARDGAPILLTATDCITQETKDATSALGSASRVVLGGTAAVSDEAAALTVCRAPAPPSQPTPPANPGNTKDCGSFATWRAAQDWFEYYYPYYGDVAQLDRDNDLIACETLPGAP